MLQEIVTLQEIAKWCRQQSRGKAGLALRELARAAEEYRPQTHVETHALGEVFNTAAARVATVKAKPRT